MLVTRLKQLLPLVFLLSISFNSIANTQNESSEIDSLCQAFFSYLPSEDGTVEFYNLSLGTYQEVEWDMGDGAIYTNPTNSFTHSYISADLYEVCLTVQDSFSCNSRFCLPVFSVGSDAFCQVADCVFPGDTDKDGQVNIFDALPIGLGFNLEGLVRPNATIEPILQAAYDWLMSLLGELDSKHADCDGNGIINEADFLAIDNNYQRVAKNESLAINTELPTVTFQFEADTLVMEGIVGNAVTIPATLSIGSEDQPVADFYGIAISFDYKKDQVQDIETQRLPSSLIQEESVFQKDKLLDDQYGLVISNTQQQGITANGPIAEVGFVIIEDLIEARTINIDLGINDIKVINSKGQEIPVSIPNDSIHLRILPISNRSVTTSTEELLAADVFISPNPAINQVQIKLEGQLENKKGQASIYNSIGKQVIRKNISNEDNYLDISTLPIGIYWIELNFEEGRVSKQIVIVN